MFPLIFVLGSALVGVVSKVGMGVAQSQQNKKLQAESLSLAKRVRSDEQKNLKINNALTKKRLDLNQDRINFDKQLTNSQIAQKEADKSYMIGSANTDFLKQRAEKVLGNDQQQYSRLLTSGRYI